MSKIYIPEKQTLCPIDAGLYITVIDWIHAIVCVFFATIVLPVET